MHPLFDVEASSRLSIAESDPPGTLNLGFHALIRVDLVNGDLVNTEELSVLGGYQVATAT
jgi:hypothetical protein